MPKHLTASAVQTGMSDDVLADRLERAVHDNWSALERDTLMLQATERLRHYVKERDFSSPRGTATDVQTEMLTSAELAAVRRALWEYRDLLDRKARVPVWPRLKPRPSNAERDEVRAERDLADAALAKLIRPGH